MTSFWFSLCSTCAGCSNTILVLRIRKVITYGEVTFVEGQWEKAWGWLEWNNLRIGESVLEVRDVWKRSQDLVRVLSPFCGSQDVQKFCLSLWGAFVTVISIKVFYDELNVFKIFEKDQWFRVRLHYILWVFALLQNKIQS